MNCIVNSINSLWTLDVFYKLCLILDSIIYTVAGWLFNTFYEIAGMSIVNKFQGFEAVYDRIKLLIGIFALFILVKSLLTNLIDPDKVVAESGKIVKNVVIAIVLLIAIPVIFDILNGFQAAVVESNAIPKLVLNTEMVEDALVEDNSFFTMNNVGNVLMNNVFLLFFRYEDFSFGNFVWKTVTSSGSNWFIDLGAAMFDTVGKAFDKVSSGSPILVLLPYTNSSKVYYEYPVISGIVGLVFCYYFLKIAVSIGIRMFKLFALQVIAPIPIILSINPSQSSVLNNYFKYLSKTYLDLFIRLFCVMLAYPVIFALTKEILPEKDNLVINLILVIALLKFAKEFPKMISDLSGLDISSGGKGPKGFLGGLFGGALSLGASAITGTNAGLKGRDLAGHMAMNTWKGASAGSKGLKNGIRAFGSSVLDNAANSYATANQIKNAGGISNYSKGRMLQRTGYDKYDAGESERLADAVKTAESEKNKYNDYLSKVNNLREASQDYFAKAMMQNEATKDTGMAYARNLSIVRNNGAGVSLDEYKAALNFVSSKNNDLEKFYNGGSDLSGTAAYAELSSLKSSVVKEVQDVDQQLGSLINSFSTLGQASTKLSDKYTEADKNLDAAQAANKAYLDSDIHRLVNMKAPKNKE